MSKELKTEIIKNHKEKKEKVYVPNELGDIFLGIIGEFFEGLFKRKPKNKQEVLDKKEITAKSKKQNEQETAIIDAEYKEL